MKYRHLTPNTPRPDPCSPEPLLPTHPSRFRQRHRTPAYVGRVTSRLKSNTNNELSMFDVRLSVNRCVHKSPRGADSNSIAYLRKRFRHVAIAITVISAPPDSDQRSTRSEESTDSCEASPGSDCVHVSVRYFIGHDFIMLLWRTVSAAAEATLVTHHEQTPHTPYNEAVGQKGNRFPFCRRAPRVSRRFSPPAHASTPADHISCFPQKFLRRLRFN